MSTDKTPGYRRIALVGGMATALGPLTAMSVTSLYPDDSAGSLDFFSSVLDAAQVSDLLSGSEQYTIFIPVNEAFLDIGGEKLASVLNDTTEVRRQAKAHVVPGRVTATGLMAETQVRSINGHEISSKVAENGIVHYVDRLL